MNEMESLNIGGSNFSFSATRIDNLGSTEYTLVTNVTDISISVCPYAHLLLSMKKAIVEACKKSPRSDNLMLRDLTFNTKLQEIHGFKLLSSINPDDYLPLSPYGYTALVDATYSAIGATLTYAKTLIDQDFDVNGCIYISTDGEENSSTLDISAIKNQIAECRKKENIESLQVILIGLTSDAQISKALQDFKDEAGLDEYIDVGDVTPQKLAKLAQFVSTSISSQSQSLGSGSASKPLTF